MQTQDEVSVENVSLDDLKFADEEKFRHEIEYLRGRLINLESFKEKFFALQKNPGQAVSSNDSGDSTARISQLETDLKSATKLAMLSMTTTGEYGAVVDFFKESTAVKDYQKLIDVFFRSVTSYGLESTVLVHGLDGDEAFSQLAEHKELDIELIEKNREQGRVYEHDGMLSVNYKNVSMLFRGFPEDDMEKKGRLHDNLVILGSGLNGSIDALNLDIKMGRQRQNLHTIVKAIPKVIDKIEQDLGTQLKKTDVMCDQVIVNTSQLVKGHGLSGGQEKELNSLLVTHKNQLHKVLAESIVIAEQFAEIMNTLERTYISSSDDAEKADETEEFESKHNVDEDVLF